MDEKDQQLVMREFLLVNDAFERSLLTMYRMPLIWLDYAAFLMLQRRITLTRETLDRALRVLPFTLHHRIWSVYLKFSTAALEKSLPWAAAEIWSRYWRVAADRSDHRIVTKHLNCLLRCKFYDDAAALLVEVAINEPPEIISDTIGPVDNETGQQEVFPSQYWKKLCQLISTHGAKIVKTPVEQVLRQAICKAAASSASSHKEQDDYSVLYSTGIFWNALATWHIRQGQLDSARLVYEEAIQSVPTVRDFALVFDSYSKMEEAILDLEVQRKENSKRTRRHLTLEDSGDLESRIKKYENLLERRPFLLSNIRLRRQPNSVDVWMERINLSSGSASNDFKYPQIYDIFEDALRTINPAKTKGSLSQLWIAFASHINLNKGFEAAEQVYRRATQSEFSSTDELARVWVAFGEFIAKEKGLDAATNVISEALVPQKKHAGCSSFLYKNSLLWNSLLDLEETRGHPDAVRCAYDRVIDLRIATPQTFVNYALFLESINAREEAFKVYERGIAAFGYPVAYDIWNVYLPKFISANASKHLELVRDLFEQSLVDCPPELARSFYIEYAALEERSGNFRNSLAILNRAASRVIDEHKPAIFDLLVKKTAEFLGSTALRPIFENAINALPSLSSVPFALRYAALETQLGEHERARAIYIHTCSVLDPCQHPSVWSSWQEFESRWGTEATFREMLRVRRSVEAKFKSSSVFVPEQGKKAFLVDQ